MEKELLKIMAKYKSCAGGVGYIKYAKAQELLTRSELSEHVMLWIEKESENC